VIVDVGSLEELPRRSIRILEAEGVEFGIVRWDDAVFALRNECPHEGGPVCRGRLSPRVTARDGQPGTLALDETTPVLACAWHGWEFDVRTGRAVWGKPSFRVRTYPVVVEDGRIRVDLSSAPEVRGRVA
jgi:nitrite reductase/ring-hydroxylating ferredoxin subunit